MRYYVTQEQQGVRHVAGKSTKSLQRAKARASKLPSGMIIDLSNKVVWINPLLLKRHGINMVQHS